LFDVGADGVLHLRVHLQPGAGRTAVVGTHGTALKVRVAAPPEGGKANDACQALLEETLGLPAGTVQLASGASSRQKRFSITGVEPDELTRRLDSAVAAGGAAPGKKPTGRESRGPKIR
jgi:uncharacterized protein (TIGR00251 family)